MLTFFELSAADTDVRFSPFVWRIKLMLAHKGLAYESKTITFADKTALEGSGLSTVPVIKDGDEWVNESLVIAKWLEEKYPENPLFEGPAAKTQAGLISNWIDRNIVMPLFPMIVSDVFAGLDDESKVKFRESREPRLGGKKIEDTRAGREAAREAYQANLAPLEAILENNSFLSGDAPGFADYCLMGAFMWAYVVTDFDPLLGDGPVVAWRERMFDLFDGMPRKTKRAA